MKKTLVLGAAGLMAFMVPAQAGTFNGWYVGLEGGANWVADWDVAQISTSGGAPSTTQLGEVSYDAGWAILATVGRSFGAWRAELEAGWRQNKLDAATFNNVPASFTDGHLREASIMANVHYRHQLTDKVALSLGAGAGVENAEFDLSSGGLEASDDRWSFAYQGIVSASYAIGSRSELFLAYRYFRATDTDFDLRPDVNTFYEGDDFVKHTATLGLRFYLNAPAPMVAPEAPPSTPASLPTEYIIFFGHNRSDLTPEAMTVIREAADTAKQTGSANVRLVGHTDRSGSDAYNHALSMKRANVVRNALVTEGVAMGAISVDAKGESEPLVPTADGVREPQNRRVNITF